MASERGAPAAGSSAAIAALAAVEQAASCAICHSIYETPLLLRSCGHTYCNTCIRQNLCFQERSGPPSCPTCRRPCDSRDLLPNTALREVLDKLIAARPLLLAATEAAAAATQHLGTAAAGANDRTWRLAPPRRQAGRKRPHAQQQQEEEESDGSRGGPVAKAAAETAGCATIRRRTRSTFAAAAAGSGGSGSKVELVDIDLAADSSSGWSEQDASSASEASNSAESDEGASSNASQAPKRQRRHLTRGWQARGSPTQQHVAAQELATDAPSGFVHCPVCSKTVPSFFINSHVDLCLVDGAHAHKPARAAGGPARPSSSRQVATAAAGPFQPLALPPKLVPSLTTEKVLRQQLRKYNMPADGKKKELLERYTKLRLAVEMANDKQECTTYEHLAKRVMAQERQMAAVQLLQPAGKIAPLAAATAGTAGKRAVLAGKGAAAAEAAAATPVQAGTAAAPAAGVAALAPASSSEVTDPSAIVLTGCGYKALIAVTRKRDAIRRRLRHQQAQWQVPAQQRQQQPPQEQAGQQEQKKAQQQEEDQEGEEERLEEEEQQRQQAPAAQRQRSSLDNSGSSLWGEDSLPLSQAQQPQWEQKRRDRRHQQHRLAAAASAGEQEQHPPNSGMAASAGVVLGGGA